MHLKRLLGRLPSRRPEVLPRIAAAYLVGNTVEAAEVVPLPQCANATQTGCFVSWNTVLEGGTAGAYWQRKLVAEPQAACTNPLTWQAGHPNDDPNEDPADGEWAPAALHRGAVPITAHVLLSRLDTQLVRARCERGALYVSAPSSWGYPADIDGGELGCCGRMHAFDIPLFWANVRANAIARTDTFLNVSGRPDEPCPPCHRNAACIVGLAWHGVVVFSGLYVLLVVMLFACGCPAACLICRTRRKRWPELYEAIGLACCCPCFACASVVVVGRRRVSQRRARAKAAPERQPVSIASVSVESTTASAM